MVEGSSLTPLTKRRWDLELEKGTFPIPSLESARSGWNKVCRCAAGYGCTRARDGDTGVDADYKHKVTQRHVSYGNKGSKV